MPSSDPDSVDYPFVTFDAATAAATKMLSVAEYNILVEPAKPMSLSQASQYIKEIVGLYQMRMNTLGGEDVWKQPYIRKG